MSDPFFSVIIPTYNRSAFIRRSISSVLNQQFQDFEVIVVDDGSTDNTESEVATVNDKRLRYFKKDNGERGAARNFGVRQARGRYINFLDSDDSFYPHHLQTAHEFLSRNPVEVFSLEFDVRDLQGRLHRAPDPADGINRKIVFGNYLGLSPVFARKEVLLENRFNEDRALSSLEDWELWIRLCARFTFHQVRKVTSTVTHHDERSVLTGDPTAIEAKVSRFISFVKADAKNRQYYGKRLNIAESSAHTYAALHLRMAGSGRGIVWDHFWRAARIYPGILLTRRSVVILMMLMGIK